MTIVSSNLFISFKIFPIFLGFLLADDYNNNADSRQQQRRRSSSSFVVAKKFSTATTNQLINNQHNNFTASLAFNGSCCAGDCASIYSSASGTNICCEPQVCFNSNPQQTSVLVLPVISRRSNCVRMPLSDTAEPQKRIIYKLVLTGGPCGGKTTGQVILKRIVHFAVCGRDVSNGQYFLSRLFLQIC